MSERMSRDEALMTTALVWAARGTCSRLKVGAVFSLDGRILAQGYNGAPAGLPHCDHEEWPPEVEKIPVATPPWVRNFMAKTGLDNISAGSKFYRDNDLIHVVPPGGDPRPTCSVTQHAEQNGIAWAARQGVRLRGSELHVTDSPCLVCARSIVNAGTRRVVFWRAYRIDDGLQLMRMAGLEVEQLTLDVRPDKIFS